MKRDGEVEVHRYWWRILVNSCTFPDRVAGGLYVIPSARWLLLSIHAGGKSTRSLFVVENFVDGAALAKSMLDEHAGPSSRLIASCWTRDRV